MSNSKSYAKKIFVIIIVVLLVVTVVPGCTSSGGVMQSGEKFTFPSEESSHEGTWLTWPHQYTYGKKYRDEVEPI